MKCYLEKLMVTMVLVMCSLQLSFAQCTPDTLAWHVNNDVYGTLSSTANKVTSLNNTVININDEITTTFLTTSPVFSFLNIDVGIAIIAPSNSNNNTALYNNHPFDPAGGCAPYSGSTAPDNVTGDGSIEDPWDSDCDPDYTQTNGSLGANCLTLGMTTVDHTDEVIVKFTFGAPVILTGMKISAIDAIGLKYTSGASLDPKEEPGSSYQDEVVFGASNGCGGAVPIAIVAGNNVSIYGDTVRANYDINSNNELTATDPNGTVTISTTAAISELTITYSNGKEDAIAEQNNPDEYTWWSATNGATNGISDGMTICLDSLFYCICPQIGVIAENTNPTQPTYALGNNFGCNGTEAIFNYTGRDGTAPYTFQVECISDGTLTTLTNLTDSTAQHSFLLEQDKVYNLHTYDANCCLTTTPISFDITYCYDVSVEKIIDAELAAIGDTIPFIIVLHNEGPETVHTLEVTDYFPAGMLYGGSYTATEGTFDGTVWSVDSLVLNEIDTLYTSLIVTEMGALTNAVEVTAMEEVDFDSTPGNAVYAEDDIANDCITVPVDICEGKTIDIDLTAASDYYIYQWYKDGVLIPGITGSTYNITSEGTYYYTTGGHPDGQCAAVLDCPIIVRYKECCTQPICQPVTTSN